MRHILPTCLLLLGLTAVPSTARMASSSAGYTRAPGLRALLHWERFPLHIFFPSGRLAARERKSLALAGFDEWVRATHGVVRYQVVTAKGKADMTVAFAPHSPVPAPHRRAGRRS